MTGFFFQSESKCCGCFVVLFCSAMVCSTCCCELHVRSHCCNVRVSSRNASFVAAYLGHLLLLESSKQEVCAVAFTLQNFLKMYVQTMLVKAKQNKCI